MKIIFDSEEQKNIICKNGVFSSCPHEVGLRDSNICNTSLNESTCVECWLQTGLKIEVKPYDQG